MSNLLKKWKILRDATRPVRRILSIKLLIQRIKKRLYLRKAFLRRSASKAIFIGITGSSGKSTTTAMLSHVLNAEGRVHTQLFESTIAKLPHTLVSMPDESNFLVAEVGMAAIGDMAPNARLLRPDIAVITKIGLEHYSAFRSSEAIAKEKGGLVEVLPATGIAFLNADDVHAMGMAERTNARIVTFGKSSRADYRVLETTVAFPLMLRVKIRCSKGDFEVQTNFVSQEFWLATVIVFAVATELGVDPEITGQRCAEFQPIWDRYGLLSIDGGPTFLVDTVKAPNESIAPTLAAFEAMDAPYKRVVFGHISDYKGSSGRAYRNAYKLARKVADQTIFMGETSHRAKASQEDIATGKFVALGDAYDVARHIRETARPGEIILLKASRNSHLERVALDWTHNVKCWETRCGKLTGCIECGLVETPFDKNKT